jgi:LPS O-antigen subunit length determinant protein (WzzB/FepE family)
MKRLKSALENLDDKISDLEENVGVGTSTQRDAIKRQSEMLKNSQKREANVLAIAQKVASRLDQTIHHVEQILRD